MKHNRKINNKKIVNEEILLKESSEKLEKENKIYLLSLKLFSNKDNQKIYAIIFKKKENISHKHCIEATKVIQSMIKKQGFDEGDYTITVSSAGFRWKFDDRFELFEDMPIKIKYRDNEDIIVSSAILEKSNEEYIIIKNEDDKNIEINKKDIIKTRLNL